MTDNTDKQGISNRTRFLLAALLICSALLLGLAAPVNAAVLSTDKADYAPWESVFISGEGFTPGATVTMTVEWPVPDSGIYEVLPAAIADGAGNITAEYALTSGPNGCGLEGAYTIVAEDSATGQSATTTFTDAYNPPAGQHWVVFETSGLPSGTVVRVTYDGYVTDQTSGPWVYSSKSVTVEVNPRKIVRAQQGRPFTYRDYSTGVKGTDGNIYTFDSVSESSPAFVVGGGSYSYVTFKYKKLDAQPANNAPTVAVDHDAITVGEGTIAENAGTWSDANSGDFVTLRATVGTVTKNGVNAGGTWSWSYSSTDGPAQSETVTITADDGKGGVTMKSFSLTVNNLAPSPSISGVPPSGQEGTAISLTGSATDPSPADTEKGFTYSWSVAKNGVAYCEGETQSFSFNPDDDASYVVTLRARDKDGGEGTTQKTIVVTNVAPTVIGTITVPTDPVRVGSPVSSSASFTDPGVLDTHTAAWTWDDSSTSAGDVTEATGTGSVSGSHTYTVAGIYTVKVRVSDKDGESGDLSATTTIVVYDPSAGFVTGGGWFNSPAGACAADPAETGKAHFAFVSKYKKDATAPASSAKFQFKVGDLDYESTSYDWLVISGSKVMCQGACTVNGADNYGFFLSAMDGSPDTIRIKIWDKSNGNAVVYDNQMSTDRTDNAVPMTSIGGGSIVVHT